MYVCEPLWDACHNHREKLRITRGFGHLGGVEQVDTSIGAEREVVVLARAVDIVEGLFLDEGGKAVTGGHLLQDLHDPPAGYDARCTM